MLALALCPTLLTGLLLIPSLAGSRHWVLVLFAGTAYYVEAGCGYGAIQVLREAFFSGNWNPPTPLIANNVEPYTFVTLFPGKCDPTPSVLRNTWMAHMPIMLKHIVSTQIIFVLVCTGNWQILFCWKKAVRTGRWSYPHGQSTCSWCMQKEIHWRQETRHSR